MKIGLSLLLIAIGGVPVFGQTYGGVFDEANCSTMSGWAWDSTQPNTPITVDIYDGVIPIATVTANQFRQDLLTAGKGNGYHGFSFAVPAILKDNQTHYPRAYFGGTTTLLTLGMQWNVTCSPSGGYQPYYADALTALDGSSAIPPSVQGPAWTQYGSITAGTGGLTSANANGGAVYSTRQPPGGATQYEVRSKLTLAASGGNYITYLRASGDALSGPSAHGSGFAVEVQNPAITSTGGSATLAVYQLVQGSVTALGSLTVPCRSGMVVRATYRNAIVSVFIDGVLYWMAAVDPGNAPGAAGVGVRGAPAGNSIARVDLGAIDAVSPSAVAAQSVGSYAGPNRVDLQWQGAADDPNGVGVAYYTVYRDGVAVGHTRTAEFSDTGVAPSTTYTYWILAWDYHANFSAITQLSAKTAPAGSLETRRTGVRPLGTYWGASGEQIDVRSGNLNFMLPLVTAQTRSGWRVPFNLTYSSQNWRKDDSITWNLGRDVGYGYGWQLLAGSITPSWTWYTTIDHYTYTDASGAEHRLDVNTNGIWTSRESVYVNYDAAAQRLYFNNGSFWVMGCTSAGTEPDAGSMYPTLMQDTNGNQIRIRYQPGVGTLWADSSARIAQIEDVRARQGPADSAYWTYNFNYTADPVPRLTSIVNNIQTAEGYLFQFSGLQQLNSPFDGTAAGSTNYLQSVKFSGLTPNYQLLANNSGELTKATFPYGGYVRWTYGTAQYTGPRYQREVEGRYLSKDGTATEQAYVFTHPGEDNNRVLHASTVLDDTGGLSQKTWRFETSAGTWRGLTTSYEQRSLPGLVLKQWDFYTWTSDPAGNPYVGMRGTVLDDGGSYRVKKVEQVWTATATLRRPGSTTGERGRRARCFESTPARS